MRAIITLLFFLGCSEIKCDVAEQYVLGLIENLDEICSQLQRTLISKNCLEQLHEACQNRTVLATFLDASSKIPYSGLLEGSRIDLGYFDECLNVNHSFHGGTMLGKYCLPGLVLTDPSDPSDLQKPFKLATCVPNGCQANDFNTVLSKFYSNVSNAIFMDNQCTTKIHRPLWFGEQLTMWLIAINVFLMTASSIYDYYWTDEPSITFLRVLLTFSVIRNGRKLFQTSKGPSKEITIFYGMKFISAIWIIAFHGSDYLNYYPVMNLDDVTNFSKKFYSVYIMSAPIAVDTFFYISGFLLAYLYLRVEMTLVARIISIPRFYRHRYMRLTPSVFMLWLYFIFVIEHLGSGPFQIQSKENKAQKLVCEKNWWTYFLYVQNYYNHDAMCLSHTWYLSAEMQLYFFSPIVIIPLGVMISNRRYEWTKKFLLILNVYAMWFPIVVAFLFPKYDNPYATHSRVIVYILGITMGTYMHQKKHEPFLNGKFSQKDESLLNLLLWIIVLLTMPIMLICPHEFKIGILINILRPVWCICLSWIVYSCYHGFGGIVNWILTRPFMQVGGKLAYSMYLLHVLVIGYHHMVTRTKTYVSDYEKFHLWCSYLVISLIASIFWTLAYEYPMILIDEILFGRVYRTN